MKSGKHKKILVIGGAGYIGSACVKALCDAGYTVSVFDNLSSGQRDKVDQRAHFMQGDILDEAALAGVFQKYSYDAVIHLAALKSVEESEKKPAEYFRTNVQGTLNILSLMESHNVPRLIFSSTAAVYYLNSEGVFQEGSKLGSVNVYGNSKILAENIITEYERTGKLKNYSIFRYFNVAGDIGLNYVEKEPKNIFPILAQAVRSGSQFQVFGNDYPTDDGTCIRDYIHLADLVEAHILALQTEHSGVFNLGTNEGKSVLDVVKEFEKESGQEVQYEFASRRPGDVATLIADATLAKEKLGWLPQHTKHITPSVLKAYEII